MKLWNGRKPMGWLGIDWGTRVIKFAQLERAGSGYRLRHKVSVRRTLSGNWNGEIDPNTWSTEDFPVGLVREGPLRLAKSACVLPMYLADLRSMELPDVPPSTQLAMVAGELSDALAEAPGERVFDIWESMNGRSQRQTQIVSIKHSLATDVAQAIRSAGPDCEVIDTLPFVLGRAIELALGPHDTAQVALDWGYTGATLCVFRGITPIYSRPLRDCGVYRIATALAESIGVSTPEAEQLLIETGFPGHTETSEIQELTSQVTGDVIRSLLEQIEKTLSYVDAEWPGVIGEQFWLFGGGGTIRHIDEFMRDKTGIEFRLWTLAGNDDATSRGSDVLFAPAAALSALAWEK